jgi:hypothetical protein
MNTHVDLQSAVPYAPFPADEYIKAHRNNGGRVGIDTGLGGGGVCTLYGRGPRSVILEYVDAMRADPDHDNKIRVVLEKEIDDLDPEECARLHGNRRPRPKVPYIPFPAVDLIQDMRALGLTIGIMPKKYGHKDMVWVPCKPGAPSAATYDAAYGEVSVKYRDACDADLYHWKKVRDVLVEEARTLPADEVAQLHGHAFFD